MTQPFPSARILRTAGPNRVIDANWVMVGWREHGKCRMLASEDIDHATLKFAGVPQHFEFRDAAAMRALGIRMARTLNAEITSYVLIEADTFAECLAALLFGFQWKPDSIRMLSNREGMGRNDGPSVQTEPAPLCNTPAFPGSVMHCQEPAGHYPTTPHAHTVTWDDEPDPGQQMLPPGQENPTP